MILEETTKSLFTSDLFIKPGDNHKTVISNDLSENMINLYRAVGIFVSEQPVRRTTERLVKLNPRMVYPMHGSCLDGSVFPKYVEAIVKRFCLLICCLDKSCYIANANRQITIS